MLLKGKLRDMTINRDGSQNVTVTVTSDFAKAFDSLKGKDLSIEIKKDSKGRSRDANSFCWALCSDIGRAMNPPIPKEEVYRMAIADVGIFIDKELIAWDVETVRRRWESHGTGWVFEVVDDAHVGWKTCNLYFGTSTYTVDEMRRVLDWLVDEATQMEIPIPLSKQEEQELLERWGKR